MIWLFFALYLIVACSTTTYMCYIGDIKWVEAERKDLALCLFAGVFWPITWLAYFMTGERY